MAVRSQRPPDGNGFPAEDRYVELAARDDTRGHIEHQWEPAAGWYGVGQRVVADHLDLPTPGQHVHAGIGDGKADTAGRRRHHGKVGEGAAVCAVANSDRPLTDLRCALQRQPHGSVGGHLSHRVMRVEHRRGGGAMHDLGLRVCDDGARLQLRRVAGEALDTVRMDTAQVGLHQRIGDEIGVRRG